MIQYFIVDLDGCISFPFQAPDWDAITAIRNLQESSIHTREVPELVICTGRPLPYVEAVAQWLGIQDTLIFESGGGFYHPSENTITWSPGFTDKIEKKSGEIRSWFQAEVYPLFPKMMLEYTKRTDVGMIHTVPDEVKEIFELCRNKVEKDYPDFEVHRTEVSVNIIARACNKASGIAFFARMKNLSSEEIAYIGDSSGDLSALRWAGAAYAPAIATTEVKKVAKVTGGIATRGVLEAYKDIIDSNRTSPDFPEALQQI